jgi:hypothetical protein
MVEILIKSDADVSATYTLLRPLQANVSVIRLAASNVPSAVQYDVLKALLDAGADPNGLDDRGLSAISALSAQAELKRPSRLDEYNTIPLFVRRFIIIHPLYAVNIEEISEKAPLGSNSIRLLLPDSSYSNTRD